MKRPGKMAREALRSLGRKPATVRYPFVKVEMPRRFRGKIVFEAGKCIGCKMCMRDCPSGAIVIRKVGERKFEADIDMARCVYCAQCVDVCPKQALESTGEFELAALSRDSLKQTFRAQPQDEAAKDDTAGKAAPA
jgi:formate hydrogenlyase subunit 6/NADH:ubiquinone oxidoreductase subunit I